MAYAKHLAAAAFGLLSVAGAAPAQDLGAGIAAAMSDLTAHVGAEEAAASVRFLSEAPAGVTGDTLGHLMFMRRHFDRAAFFFGLEATAAPDAPTLNNFSTMLEQVWSDDPGFSAHFKFEGDGSLNSRVETAVPFGPVEAFAGIDGHYDNKTGGVSVDNFKGGVRYVVLPKNVNDLDVGSNFKIPITYTQVPSDGGASSVFDAATFNAGDIAN